MTDRERYVILSALLDGKTEATGELRFRAYLCTALREAGVYPQEGL